jgi:hypothetical protein
MVYIDYEITIFYKAFFRKILFGGVSPNPHQGGVGCGA